MQHVLGSLDNNPLLMDVLIKKQVGIDCLPFMGMDSKFSPGLAWSRQPVYKKQADGQVFFSVL